MPCKCPEGSICEHEMHAVRLAMSEGVTGPEPHQQDLDFELIEEARAVANSYPGKFGVDADLVKKLLSVIDRRAATQ